MAATSWAHIRSYSASVAAIAGALNPNMFDATSEANCVRLPASAPSGTAAASAAS